MYIERVCDVLRVVGAGLLGSARRVLNVLTPVVFLAF